MKYKFMEEHREVYKVCNMCRVLKISRSGYYAWRNRLPSTRRRDNEDLSAQDSADTHSEQEALWEPTDRCGTQ